MSNTPCGPLGQQLFTAYMTPKQIGSSSTLVDSKTVVLTPSAAQASSGDEKQRSDAALPPGPPRLLRQSGHIGSIGPITTWLAIDIDITSAANTALTSVVPVAPGNSPEFTSYASVYDEYKATEFKLHFKETLSGTPSDNGQLAVVAYDPLNGTALGSTAAGADHSRHMLWGQNFSTASATAIPSNVTSHGLMQFDGRLAKGVQLAALNEIVGIWAPTNVSATYGQLKFYVESLGSSATSNIRGILYVRTSFRSRG